MSRLGVAFALLAGCYDPTPAADVPCGPGGVCPAGQTCSADDRCVPAGGGDIDAPATDDAAEPDASIDAPIDAFVRVAPAFRAVVSADGTTTTTMIGSPPGTQIGDLLVAHVVDDGVLDSTTIATPAGWTRVVEGDAVQDRFAVIIFVRFAAAASESFTFTFPDSLNFIELMAFTGVNPTAPVDTSAGNALTDASQPTAPSITTTQPDTLLVTFYTLDLSADTFDPAPGMTERYDIATGQLQIAADDAALAAAGATGDRVARRSGADVGPTINLAIALAPR